MDVTRCSFAEFFKALGEPELGALLICQTDFDIAAVGAGEVKPRACPEPSCRAHRVAPSATNLHRGNCRRRTAA